MLVRAMAHLVSDKAVSGKKAARQLAGHLREQIEHGQIKSGDRILSERQLARRYAQSLHTVRLALGQLKADGTLVSHPKSGLYVAEAAIAVEPSIRAAGGRKKIRGFSLLDAPGTDPCDLQFLIGSWNVVSRDRWREICRRYSAAPSEVWIDPEFPDDIRDYRRLLNGADVFISTPMQLYKSGRLRPDIHRLDPDDLLSAGVESRYVQAVVDSTGRAIGVPINASLLVGYLNRRLLPEGCIDRLGAAASWEEVFELLAEASAASPDAHPLNIHPLYTFNLHQYLTIAAGGLLHGGRVDLHHTGARRALERLERFLDRTHSRPKFGAGRMPDTSAMARIEYTCRAEPVNEQPEDWAAWRYPLGEGGRYMEGVNVAMMSRLTLHREAALAFLMHLTAPAQQSHFMRSPHEQPISARLDNPWGAYDAEQAAIFSPMRRKARVFAEWAPGYSRLIDRIMPPLARQWLGGGMSLNEFHRAVEERGNECLAACRAGEAT